MLLVGDSNINLGSTSIVRVLASKEHQDNGYVPVLAARDGASIRTYDCLVPEGCRTTDFWETKLGELLPELTADAIVINLGINDTIDVGTETTPGYRSYAEKADWLMSLLPASTPVLWTNLPCSIEPPLAAKGCAAVNDALRLAPRRWSNLRVVDFEEAARGHPEYMGEPGVDVHLSPAGYTAWAELVVEALDERFSTTGL
ncbi:MAG: GDSL-type esterase/lipase family protein [Acidimicrobiales bacterium]